MKSVEIDLPSELRLFVDFKSGEMLKERTIHSYLYHLRALLEYSSLENLERIQASDIAKFLTAERERGLSPATIVDRYRALKVFFNWRASCEELGKPLSPMVNIKKPRLPTTEPRRAALSDMRKLIRVIPERNWLDDRNRALLQLMLDTGLRLSEATNLAVKDVDLDNRIVLVRYGKGDKSRRVPFTKKTVLFVNTYLKKRPKSKFNKSLWLSAFNEDGDMVRGVLTDHGIRSIIERLCLHYKVPHINPHSIRHLFGMKALNDGIRIEVVSAMLGHTSIDFTRRVYAPLLTETTKREYDKHWNQGIDDTGAH